MPYKDLDVRRAYHATYNASEKARAYQAAHRAAHRESERVRSAHYRCTTKGILNEERRYQKRVRGGANGSAED